MEEGPIRFESQREQKGKNGGKACTGRDSPEEKIGAERSKGTQGISPTKRTRKKKPEISTDQRVKSFKIKTGGEKGIRSSPRRTGDKSKNIRSLSEETAEKKRGVQRLFLDRTRREMEAQEQMRSLLKKSKSHQRRALQKSSR